jgi:hypothetical protein
VPSWNELLNDFQAQADADKGPWLVLKTNEAVARISALRNDRNVLMYGSAFLQKPQAPAPSLQITYEDLNGLMSVMYGMDWAKGLTLMLHTAGGATNAAETIVAYLRSKFGPNIEAIVPTFAMSAGTMIGLSTQRVIMGRQSQLGPIDPQMPVGGRYISARAVVEQFERGVSEVKSDLTLAHVWAPILQTMGPALLQEAQNALDYGESMVAKWAATGMFAGHTDADRLGAAVARHFNDATTHKSHGRRIDRVEAGANNVIVEELEASQDLQDAVLTAYHLMTLFFEQSACAKMMWTSHGRTWMKNWVPAGAVVAP